MCVNTTEKHAPFGTLLGYAPGGVAIYSSNYESLNDLEQMDDASFRHYLDKEYMGYKLSLIHI